MLQRSLSCELDAAELGALLADLGEEWEPSQLKDLVTKLDTNRSGFIECSELLRWWESDHLAGI